MSEPINSPDREPALSIRDRLRQQREKARQDNTLDLIVPGYDGDLAVRYRPLPEDEIQRFAESIQGNAGMKSARQLIVSSCETILVREDGELEPLLDDEDDPVRFDDRLAEVLGFETESALETVAETFSPGGTKPLAIMGHGLALINWMQGKDLEVDKALLGE